MNEELAEHISLLAAPIYAQMRPSMNDDATEARTKRKLAILLAIALWRDTVATKE